MIKTNLGYNRSIFSGYNEVWVLTGDNGGGVASSMEGFVFSTFQFCESYVEIADLELVSQWFFRSEGQGQDFLIFGAYDFLAIAGGEGIVCKVPVGCRHGQMDVGSPLGPIQMVQRIKIGDY